jgi:hypothetical protein
MSDLRPLAKPIRDVPARLEWARDRDVCMVCGLHVRFLRRRFPAGLFTHHICGNACRSDEPCNLLRVCARDHDRIHANEVTLGNVLWCKRQYDAENYDAGRIMALRGRASLPDLEPPPRIRRGQE